MLPQLVQALVSALQSTDGQVQPDSTRPSPPLWDLLRSARPHWLGQSAGLSVPSTLTDAQARAYIAGRGVSQRGKPTALKAAVAATLTGAQKVTLVERDGGDPYVVRVVTYSGQTPDPARTLAAALTEKPQGLLLIHEVAAGQDFADTTAEGKTFGQHTATGRTFQQRSEVLPVG